MDKFLVRKPALTLITTSNLPESPTDGPSTSATSESEPPPRPVDEDPSSDDENEPPLKKKKKSYRQKYITKWADEDSTISEWLVRTQKGMMCKVCNRDIGGGITHIKRHEKTTMHNKNINAAKSSGKMTDTFIKKKTSTLNLNVKRAETKLVMYIAEQNQSFRSLDTLSKLIGDICPDSDIAKQIKCGRKKGTNICVQVTAPCELSKLTSILRKTHFSIILDETTDVSTAKCLAVLVRYYHNKSIKDSFLSLIEVKESTAEYLFTAVIDLLKLYEIPIDHFIGFAADNAAVMMGDRKGLKARFKEINPNIFVLGCTCHSFHLAASAACKKLPSYVERFARDVCNYFAHSSKRVIELKECQVFLDLEPHKILKLSQTRWLSLEAVVNRLLEQWSALILTFTAAIHEGDDTQDFNAILNALNNPHFKIYFTFLSYILKQVNKLTLEFQSESPKLYLLHNRVSDLYRCILKNFIKPEVVNKYDNILKIDVNSPGNYLECEDIYLGAKSDLYMKQRGITNNEIQSLKKHCLQFYIELSNQIRSRFDFESDILKNLTILDPKVALSGTIQSIVPIAQSFPNLVKDIETLNDEWRMLDGIKELKQYENKTIAEFWHEVFVYQNSLNQNMFVNLTFFISGLLSFPHSSAAAERIFSQLNLIKTNLRNRLTIETCNALILTKQLLGEQSSVQFQPDDILLRRNIQENRDDVDLT